jgi:hypothetical protein
MRNVSQWLDLVSAGIDGLGILGSATVGQVVLPTTARLGWSATANPHDGAGGLTLYKDASDILAQRRTTNVQEFRLYETWTDASNYSRLAFRTAAGDFDIIPEALGTGTLRGLNIGAAAGNLCFYEGTPVALQTGVAVSAAGIHAALVALNLITA